MTCDLTNPIFTDEMAAAAHMEADRWPNGEVYCPLCGVDYVTKMGGKTQAGMFMCNGCRGKFTVRTGTVFERSHIPLHKWLLATHLMASSKKGVSAHQLHRMLGITYKSAWFMAHRIREAMAPAVPSPIGGEGKFVEVDESRIGGKAKNKAYGPPPKKHIVMSLVERGGQVRSFHVANVTAATLRPIIVKIASRKSDLMTDEGNWYTSVGQEFASHGTVDHSWDEYVRHANWYKDRAAYIISTNTVEGYFSLLKRGITGVYHHVSEAHLHRYLDDFDFCYNNRAKLGVGDGERAAKLLKGAVGKRLTYRGPHKGKDDSAKGQAFSSVE
jgi:transposase-like protein